MLNGTLGLPPNEPLPGAPTLGPMPYVIVADEAFPLKQNIMRPYPGRNLTENRKIYRHSRARRTSENAFGLLAGHWRMFHTKMATNPDLTVRVIRAACILHNLCITPGSQSTESNRGEDESIELPVTLQQMRPKPFRSSTEAMEVRDNFMKFFAETASVSWQVAHVNKGRNNIA